MLWKNLKHHLHLPDIALVMGPPLAQIQNFQILLGHLLDELTIDALTTHKFFHLTPSLRDVINEWSQSVNQIQWVTCCI